MTVSDAMTSLGAALASKYVLERELGRGGMATVYLARDLRHDRSVALKVLRPELGATLGSERFQREIHVAARLSHPNILPLFDSGEADGRLWYAMPFVQGESLRQRVTREGQLGVAEAVGITRQVAAGLAYAHAQGIVHRDIKPENILLAGDQVLVADFGIAKAVDASSAEKLTETGLSLGTPAYMSPEQTAGGAVSARSDVYALGCVLYEMLAGVPPFTGPTAQAIMARHSVDPVPPLRTVRATIPWAVEQAIIQALAKVPADRFPTATKFADALIADLGPRPGLGWPVSGRATRAGLGGIVGISLAAGAAWIIRERSIPAVAPSAETIAVLPLVSAAADTGLVRLGRDLAVTISASLDGIGAIETADRLSIANATADRPNLSPGDGAALARRLGARSILRGTLVRAGDNVRLDLGLYGTEGLAPLAEGITVSNHRDSVVALTDSAVWALLRQVWQRGKPPSPSLDAVTTRSLPALRAFLDGERKLGANRWVEALMAYRGALIADSAFAMAHFRYVLTRLWTNDPVPAESLQVLRSRDDVFPERERLLLDAVLTSYNAPRLKIERHAVAARRFPDYWPSWFLYADALYHGGPLDGHDWLEGLDAFHRVVALNPGLVPAWDHIFWLTTGKDSLEMAKAFARLSQLGWLDHEPEAAKLMTRLLVVLAVAGGRRTPGFERVADSVADRMSSTAPGDFDVSLDPIILVAEGYPAAQLELNDRALATGRASPQTRAALRAANAWAWAARGRWDSAVTTMAEVARNERDVPGTGPSFAFQDYGLTVVGALLGAIPPTLADERRSRVVEYVAKQSNREFRDFSRSRLAWLDGVLSLARGDRSALQAARKELRSIRWENRSQHHLIARSLAAFDRTLAGDRKRAGRELAELEEECVAHDDCNSLVPDIAIQRFLAAQWLVESGETERARRLLRWPDTPWLGWPWTLGYALSGPTFLSRARIEHSMADTAASRAYYQQFLRRYDRPMASLAPLVEEALEALSPRRSR